MTFEEDKKGFSELWKSKWDMYQFMLFIVTFTSVDLLDY
jgi:hypothetical protein